MLKNLLASSKKGFTLIEIVIVLAIAGLIFVIVFFAVSQAQASRRDTQRKNDANRVLAAVAQWSSNHNGEVPDSAADIGDVVTDYVNDFTDPTQGSYTVSYTSTAPSSLGQMSYASGQKCNADATSFTTTGAGARSYAIMIFLEKGGAVCVGSGG